MDARELPTGTVTLLFTDVEGSTRLLRQQGDRYRALLDDHDRILRAAISRRHGTVVDTQGDSFFAVFARAREAIDSAIDAQRALATHEWHDGVRVLVRIGVHTGEPELASKRYVGLAVHRAARICAAGHGGQVLVSQATRELVAESSNDFELHDLGEHRLKDLEEPEHIYQVAATGLAREFPPLRADAATPFSGRESELARRIELRPLIRIRRREGEESFLMKLARRAGLDRRKSL